MLLQLNDKNADIKNIAEKALKDEKLLISANLTWVDFEDVSEKTFCLQNLNKDVINQSL